MCSSDSEKQNNPFKKKSSIYPPATSISNNMSKTSDYIKNILNKKKSIEQSENLKEKIIEQQKAKKQELWNTVTVF